MRTMFKTFARRAVLATAFFALAVTGCSDDSGTSAANEPSSDSAADYWYHNNDDVVDEESSPSKIHSGKIDDDGVNGESSSSNVKPSSSSDTKSASSDTPSSQSSTESASSTTSSAASAASATLTPLLDYELTQPFIDEGWRDECLKLLNEYRATEDLEPMTLADAEKQQCAIDQAAADMADNAAHGHFGDCGESAQNSGPNFSTSWRSNATGAVQYYEMAMWEKEKAKVEQGITEYQQIGHYLNMKNSYSKVACGIAISADGKKGWCNMNFYR